jgi:hypothetical protein
MKSFISLSQTKIWWLAFAALALILLSPLMATEIPPLLDYPNHLARMEILAHGAGNPALSRIYTVHWHILPNIGIDLAMPLLMRIMPLALAGKVFIGLALILPLLGVAVLHRALFRHVSYWPLAAGLVAYNRLLFAGFLNFLIGIGLAMLAAALWEALRGKSIALRVGSAMVAAIAIFFCHLIALGFYGLLLASLEAAILWREKRVRIGPFIQLAIVFAIPAVLYLAAPISGAPISDSPEAGGHGLIDAIKHYYWALAAEPSGLKLYGLVGPFLTYDRILDFAALTLVAATLAAFAVGRQLRIAPSLGGLFLGLLAAYPLVPFYTKGTAWVDQRIPIMAGFLLFAGTLPLIRANRTRTLMAAAFGIAILVRVVGIAQIWSTHDADIADFRQVIRPVGAGERVLVVQAERNADPAAMVNNPDSVRAMRENDSTMHLPALLVIERHAFWPLLFTASTKQPVGVLPPYDAISLPEGELPWIGGLADPGPADLKWAPYLTGWETKFDWVLVLHPADAPDGYDLLPDRLDPVERGKIAALYRIRR